MTKLDSSDPVVLEMERLAFDDGCRAVLREHLAALVALADKQAERSKLTEANSSGSGREARLHHRDKEFAANLRAVLEARK